MKHIEIR